MTGDNNDISVTEQRLFRDRMAKAGVKPLKPLDPLPPQPATNSTKPKPTAAPRPKLVQEKILKPTPRQTAIDTSKIIRQGHLSFYRSGLQKKQFEDLCRGKFKARDKLDLHIVRNRKEAEQMVVEFILQCTQQDKRYIEIIHGKGNHSRDGKSVIKEGLHDWLLHNDKVLAVCPIRTADGGSGAVRVMLKKKKRY